MWFLAPEERGNAGTRIDRRRDDGRAWTEGNRAVALIHGARYFARLHDCLCSLGPGDLVCFTDWRGDADERLRGPGTEVGMVLANLARAGVSVRGLVWRSHSDQGKFSEQENRGLAEMVNTAGGEALLDERVRRTGSHHQKLVLIRHPGRTDEDVAFVGGIDLCHGRADDERHRGDPQAIELDERFGPRPAWHDAQLELHGPAIGDLAETFRERWDDPTPLTKTSRWRAALGAAATRRRQVTRLPPMLDDPSTAGPHVVQILRTYPARDPPYPFAPHGERSVARAYAKAFRRARSLIYVEDQYLWSPEVASVLASALIASPDLRVIALVPRVPDQDGRLSGPPSRIGQLAAMRQLVAAGGDRFAVYDLEDDRGRPIYVHAKVCVVDDVWATVGSDNLNRRSWTHDSELSCAVLDETIDTRSPRDAGGIGDGARVFARELRLGLWREHLGVGVPDEELLDPVEGFERWRRSAADREAWHRAERRGPAPPGRIRVHRPEPVGRFSALWAWPAYRFLIDPDGRPRGLQRRGGF